ncbi:MAG: radical SAM protein [Elusimicrobiota bacterium]
MECRLITCGTLIKKITAADTLFGGVYCIDPYQNCDFGCLYCDSSIDKTIYVKTNASTILQKELKQVEKGVIIIGSVRDPYQKAEEKYGITKNLLKTIKKYHFPCHILTKSTLVLRNVNLLSDMRCVITMSIVSLDKNIARIFEENAPLPKERMQTVKTLIQHSIKTGIALMPVLPFLAESNLQDVVKTASRCNAQHLLHKHLELKGDHRSVFMDTIKNNYPHLLSKYEGLYKGGILPDRKYIAKFDNKMHELCKKYNLSERILL